MSINLYAKIDINKGLYIDKDNIITPCLTAIYENNVEAFELLMKTSAANTPKIAAQYKITPEIHKGVINNLKEVLNAITEISD
ncbi:hypothetical protein [Candidatus Trichorickettsia mobilis]|uniref:hypothetical protein n=1 Tax=Candidatus Trichorickettsia mobilis TaxID=1346319 RepID=UPI002930BD60|nr:hypothetical protein [Candidatus Trichorickettsia mobilis]